MTLMAIWKNLGFLGEIFQTQNKDGRPDPSYKNLPYPTHVKKFLPEPITIRNYLPQIKMLKSSNELI